MTLSIRNSIVDRPILIWNKKPSFFNVFFRTFKYKRWKLYVRNGICWFWHSTRRDYLKNNFNTMNWDKKCQLAFQIANAVECLHNEGIIHRDMANWVYSTYFVYRYYYMSIMTLINMIFLFFLIPYFNRPPRTF